MKVARVLVATGKVLSSNFTAPILKGVVQDGTTSYRSGLVLKSGIDLENICSCRASRDWGTICAHSVAVGLHHLKLPAQLVAEEKARTAVAGEVTTSTPARPEPRRLRRARDNEPSAEPLEIHVILPPNFAEAAQKGKVMLVFEGKWSRGRSPVNALPKEQPFRLSDADEKLLSRIEDIAGEPAGMLVIATREFTELLPVLTEHPRITLGKAAALSVKSEPWLPPLRATLESNGEITLATNGSLRGPVLIDVSWIFANNTLQPLGLARGLLPALQSPLRISRAQVPAFLNNDWPKLNSGAAVQANFALEDFAVAPQAPKFILNLTGGLAMLTAQLQCNYPARILTLG